MSFNKLFFEYFLYQFRYLAAIIKFLQYQYDLLKQHTSMVSNKITTINSIKKNKIVLNIIKKMGFEYHKIKLHLNAFAIDFVT